MGADKETIGILVLLSVVGATITYFAFRPITSEGVVDHKAITGRKGGVSHTILTVTDTGTIVKNEDLRSLLSNSTVIDESTERAIRSEYSDLRHLISVRSQGETTGYYASREDFNRVDVGDEVRYRVSRLREATIRIIKSNP